MEEKLSQLESQFSFLSFDPQRAIQRQKYLAERWAHLEGNQIENVDERVKVFSLNDDSIVEKINFLNMVFDPYGGDFEGWIVDWTRLVSVEKSKEGSDGVLFVGLDDREVVLKFSESPVIEGFASLLGMRIGLNTPKMRIVGKNESVELFEEDFEFEQLIYKLKMIGKNDSVVGGYMGRAEKRSFAMVFGKVPGVPLGDCYGDVSIFEGEDGVRRLRDIGNIIAFDAITNNWDRIPIITDNEGNYDNILIDFSIGGRISAIDNIISCLNSNQAIRDYTLKVKELINESVTVCSVTPMFQKFRDSMINFMGIELTSDFITEIKIGTLEMFNNISFLNRKTLQLLYDRLGSFIPQKAKEDLNVGDKIWWSGMESINLDFLDSIILCIKEKSEEISLILASDNSSIYWHSDRYSKIDSSLQLREYRHVTIAEENIVDSLQFEQFTVPVEVLDNIEIYYYPSTTRNLETPTFMIVGGVHGNETMGIEACYSVNTYFKNAWKFPLASMILAHASVVIVPLINNVGYLGESRCCPSEGLFVTIQNGTVKVKNDEKGSIKPPEGWSDPNRYWEENNTLVKKHLERLISNYSPSLIIFNHDWALNLGAVKCYGTDEDMTCNRIEGVTKIFDKYYPNILPTGERYEVLHRLDSETNITMPYKLYKAMGIMSYTLETLFKNTESIKTHFEATLYIISRHASIDIIDKEIYQTIESNYHIVQLETSITTKNPSICSLSENEILPNEDFKYEMLNRYESWKNCFQITENYSLVRPFVVEEKSTMKISLFQTSKLTPENLDSFLYDERSNGRKPDFIICPEDCLSPGIVSLEQNNELNEISKIIEKHAVYALIGSLIEEAGTSGYITSILLDKTGKIAGQYRKRTVSREFNSGESKTSWNTSFGIITVLIGADISDANILKDVLKDNPKIILNPISSKPPKVKPEMLLSAWKIAQETFSRDFEALCSEFGVTIVRCGRPYPLGFGNSMVITPCKTVYGNSFTENHFSVEIDLVGNQFIAKKPENERTEKVDNTGNRYSIFYLGSQNDVITCLAGIKNHYKNRRNQFVVSGSKDGIITIWDTYRQGSKQTIQKQSAITSLALSEKYLLSGEKNSTLSVFNAHDFQVIFERDIPSNATVLHFLYESEVLFFCGLENGNLLICNLESDDLVIHTLPNEENSPIRSISSDKHGILYTIENKVYHVESPFETSPSLIYSHDDILSSVTWRTGTKQFLVSSWDGNSTYLADKPTWPSTRAFFAKNPSPVPQCEVTIINEKRFATTSFNEGILIWSMDNYDEQKLGGPPDHIIHCENLTTSFYDGSYFYLGTSSGQVQIVKPEQNRSPKSFSYLL